MDQGQQDRVAAGRASEQLGAADAPSKARRVRDAMELMAVALDVVKWSVLADKLDGASWDGISAEYKLTKSTVYAKHKGDLKNVLDEAGGDSAAAFTHALDQLGGHWRMAGELLAGRSAGAMAKTMEQVLPNYLGGSLVLLLDEDADGRPQLAVIDGRRRLEQLKKAHQESKGDFGSVFLPPSLLVFGVENAANVFARLNQRESQPLRASDDERSGSSEAAAT